jgi:hypothetical protein
MDKHHRRHGTIGFDDADFAELARLVRQDDAVRAAHRATALEGYMP